MDIDGVEMCTLMGLLTTQWWFRPKLIHVEVNPAVPPPFEYGSGAEDEGASWSPGRCASCSIGLTTTSDS